MFVGLVFGWRTALLLFVIVQLLAIAAALPRSLANRTANRTLAALLVVLVGILVPWMIGFAGFYDRWHWLTFAPFACPLAVAPLLWAYVETLFSGRTPARLVLHLAPAGAHFAFMAVSFLLPWHLKDPWSDVALGPIGRLTGIGTVVGLAAYGWASMRMLESYRERLAAQRSDDTRYAARWLSRAVGAMLILLPVWATYATWDALSPLDYYALMGLHVAIAIFALYLAIEGWRHAALAFPVLEDIVPSSAARDWRAQGTVWAAQVRAELWAADPELSLATLARRLGTNTSYLSRALNEGLKLGFSSFIIGLRSETVARALDDGSTEDLLDLAFAAGFSSKASFNRAFHATYGMTPSTYRRASANRTSQEMNFGTQIRI